MANDLKTRDARDTDLRPGVTREQNLARVQAVPWLIVIGLLAAVAFLTWRAFFYQEEGDPVGSAMLAFERQNSLTVFSSRFEVVAESEDTRGVMGVPVLRSRQATIVPATVEYRLDLSGMDRGDFVWDEAGDRLTVTLPQLQTSRPNIDEGAARVFTEGAYVTRDAAQDLARNNSQQAERKATAFAKNPEILALARQAAREAVRQNLTIPLQVAGYGDVSVDVRFEDEGAN
ncbi:hypothetical protein GCM10022600_09410 [Qipengyuania pelagi]|jgi:hypothetical protein|uniref:DUF4230 domain-containing protein n=1 Tax=Qipengyuania pelagi TaxID=994320 RepID=A0A844Y7H2_9SPHN|nr:DUF4230 domain-containing protein [Qipengyuania pelagi]MXO54184.1 DUF4230 domain-containing protein [Qipengyuania pelagi]